MKQIAEKIRSLGLFVLVMLLVLSSFGVVPAVASENVDEIAFVFRMDDARYSVNGVVKDMEAPLLVRHDTIFVPCSAIPKELGFYIEWFKGDFLYFRHNGIQIRVHPYDQTVNINGEDFYWDEENFKVNPKCFDGVLFMPMLSFAKFLGAKDTKVADTGEITLTFDRREENLMTDTYYERVVEFPLYGQTATVDGDEYEAGNCLTKKDDEIYINVELLVSAFGYETYREDKKLHYYRWNYDSDEKFVNYDGYVTRNFRMYMFAGAVHILEKETIVEDDQIFAPLEMLTQIGMDVSYDEELFILTIKHSVPDDVKVGFDAAPEKIFPGQRKAEIWWIHQNSDSELKNIVRVDGVDYKGKSLLGINGRVCVPIGYTAMAFGGLASGSGNKFTVKIKKQKKFGSDEYTTVSATFEHGSDTCKVDGKPYQMSFDSVFEDGTMYISIRDVGDIFGLITMWDSGENKLTLLAQVEDVRRVNLEKIE